MNDFPVSFLLKRCLLLITLVPALLLSGCGDSSHTGSDGNTAQEDAQRVISGKVMYRERIALPENVTVTVTLADVSRADAPMKVLAQEHIDNPGQVPVSFSLRYQTAAVTQTHPHAYAVRAEIRSADGELLWTTTERHSVDLASDVAPAEMTLMLQRVSAQEGASLSPAMQQARDEGASFWAMGNEPGWHVAIYPDDRIVYVGDYGNTQVTLPYADPEMEGTEAHYLTGDEAHQLALSISERPCQDSMSGSRHDYDVIVTLNEHEYRGCGNNL